MTLRDSVLSRYVPLRVAAAATVVATAVTSAFAPLAFGVAPTHSSGTDFAVLFERPTMAELDQVRADWLTRQPVVDGFRVEATGLNLQGVETHILSHIVDGERHFGALRFPRNYVAGGVYQTMLLCHGGLAGIDLNETSNFLATFPGQCIDDEAFLLVPSFRGEEMLTNFAGTFVSGGSKNFADRDVDDTRALLSAALENYPAMDPARVAAYGISRGAAVAMLTSIRDDRVRRVVDLFGFTDLSLPSVRARLDQIVNQGAQPMGIGRVAYESSLEPWLSGAMTLSEARLAWIRRSPCYFAESLPLIQAHHGLSDTQVDASHTTALLDELFQLGRTSPEVEGFFYPGGLHGLQTLPGHGDRVEPFLCELLFGPRGYCGPMSPTANGLYATADYRGSCSLANNDFVFRANNLPASSFGLVFASNSTAYAPSGAGFICVGQGFQRVGIGSVDAAGIFSLGIDFRTQNQHVAPLLNLGGDVYFQVVFRDIGNPLGGFNFSNGLAMTILP